MNSTINTDTPRTDKLLFEQVPYRDCLDNAQEAFDMMLDHARELEREINEMTGVMKN